MDIDRNKIAEWRQDVANHEANRPKCPGKYREIYTWIGDGVRSYLFHLRLFNSWDLKRPRRKIWLRTGKFLLLRLSTSKVVAVVVVAGTT